MQPVLSIQVFVAALTIGEKNYKSKRGIIAVTSLVQNLEEDLGRCKSVAQMSSPPILSECVSHRRATTWCMRARVLEAATVAADTVALAAARPAASRRFAAAAARARDVEGEQRCDGVVGGRERAGGRTVAQARSRTDRGPSRLSLSSIVARGRADDTLASSLPVCLRRRQPAYPRVEVTLPVCLYGERDPM